MLNSVAWALKLNAQAIRASKPAFAASRVARTGSGRQTVPNSGPMKAPAALLVLAVFAVPTLGTDEVAGPRHPGAAPPLGWTGWRPVAYSLRRSSGGSGVAAERVQERKSLG